MEATKIPNMKAVTWSPCGPGNVAVIDAVDETVCVLISRAADDPP